MPFATTGAQYTLSFQFLNSVGYGAAPLTVKVFAGTTQIGLLTQAKLTTFPSSVLAVADDIGHYGG